MVSAAAQQHPAAAACAYLGLVYQIRGNASNSWEGAKLMQHLHCRGCGVARLNSKQAGHDAGVRQLQAAGKSLCHGLMACA